MGYRRPTFRPAPVLIGALLTLSITATAQQAPPQPAPAEAPAPPPVPAEAKGPPPAPQAPAELPSFWIVQGGEPVQLDADAIRRAVREGRIRRDTPVWRPGMKDWTRAGEVAALRALLEAAGPPPPPPVPRFHVLVDGRQQGPFTLEELETMAREGRLDRATLVWRPGMKAWKAAGEVAVLARLLDRAAPPKPPAEVRFRDYLVGTWQGAGIENVGGVPTRIEVEYTYRADGTVRGTQVYTPQGDMPVPPATVVVTGTWKVKALGDRRFSITMTLTPSGAGVPQIPQTSTTTLVMVDDDTVRDERTGNEYYRVR